MLVTHHKCSGQSASINIATSGNRITCSIKIKCKEIKKNCTGEIQNPYNISVATRHGKEPPQVIHM
jgi:hypothetical protein